MAEFCLKCWNQLNDTHLTKKDVSLLKYLDLCEGCGEMKNTIIKYKKSYVFAKHIEWLLKRKRGEVDG